MEVVKIIGDDAEDAQHLVDVTLEKGTDAVAVVGGNGVISNALQVLASNDIPLSIIPTGSGRDPDR